MSKQVLETNSQLNPLFKLRNYILDNHRENKSHFLGQVLTIIDAGIADKEQRKAMKNLVSSAFYSDSYGDDMIRYAIISFAKKFAKDTLPETSEEMDAFFSRCPQTTSVGNPDYFSEYK